MTRIRHRATFGGQRTASEHRGRAAGRVALVVIGLVVAACGGEGPAGSNGPSGPAAEGGALVERFGYGPRPDDSITYQPDVVLIEGGPSAIRSVSDDGLAWTLAGDAGGVAQLVPGVVMLASSSAAGRVVQVTPVGDDVEVLLAPVGLTDLIRDAHLVVDEVVPLDSLDFLEIRDLPGALTEGVPPDTPDGTDDGTAPDPDGTNDGAAPDPDGAGGEEAAPKTTLTSEGEPLVVLPPLELVAATSPAQGDASRRSTNVGDWTVTAYRGAGTLGISATRGVQAEGGLDVSDGLKVVLDAHIEVSDLRFKADVPVTRGEVGQSSFEVSGITGLNLSLEAGAPGGLLDNRNVKVEIPIQLTRPIIIGGFPATITQKFKFLVNTAFSARNGTIVAAGSWSLDGPLGFDGSTLTTPTLAERGSQLVESIEGVSVGINSIVAAVGFEFGVAVGIPVAGAGPVAKLITSVALLNGSDLGIVKCRQATTTAVLSGGVGINLYDPVRQALRRMGVEVPTQATLASADLLKETWVTPDVAACRS